MLPWWFWVLLWIVLVLGMLLFFVLTGIKLFRGFMKLVNEAGEASGKVSEALRQSDEPIDYGVIPPRAPAGVPALFRDPQEARDTFDSEKEQRIEVRRARRVARKVQRGQPQRVSDLKLF